jgi:hypothetical protein
MSKAGRPPLRKKGAFTDAERQRRRRQKLRRERSDELQRIAARRMADQKLLEYVPYPPGVSYWITVKVQTADGEREVWSPQVKPPAQITHSELTDEEVLGLLRQIIDMAKRRGLAVAEQ